MKTPKIKTGSSQYKTTAHMLYKWLKYASAPSGKEQEWCKALASSISIRMHRYCWPEARGFYKTWKKVLKLQEQYRPERLWGSVQEISEIEKGDKRTVRTC